MAEEKRMERDKATRQERIQQALNERKQKGYSNKYGMSAAQIRGVLGRTLKQENRLPPDPKTLVESRRSKVVRSRPRKVSRRPRADNHHRLLLEVPVNHSHASFEYPTPPWFKKGEKADVSVIVPLYKSDKHIANLINSWDLKEALNVELILVDDCCPNNSKEVALRAWHKRRNQVNQPIGRIFFSSVNQGFGMTCNTGAHYATGDYLIFLNADTRVTEGWIRPMIRLLQSRPDVGLVGNMHLKLHGPWHGRINSAGSEWNWETMTFRHRAWEQYNQIHLSQPFTTDNMPSELRQPHEVEMVTGACLAVRRKDFLEIGGFNPNYRIGYWEDSELSLSLREKGFKVMFTPHSRIWHEAGHSNSGGHKHANHNTNYFVNKWVNSGRIDPLVEAKRVHPNPTVRDILVRRREAHGDVLVAAAVVSGLKKKYPEARILFNTNHPEIVEGHPDIDRVLKDSEISERLFQLYHNLDMAYEYRPRTNILTAYAESAGVKSKDCKPFLKTKPVAGLPSEYVVVHAGKTNWAGRNWSPMKFDLIANKLKATGRKVICVGRGDDHGIPCDIDFRNKTTVHELAYIIKNAQMFVGIDSFPMHIAQTFDIPGVCFFGSINPETRIYSNKMVPVVVSGLNCLGCHHRKPAPCTSTMECEMGHMDCINKLSTETMWKKIEEVWNGNKQSVYEKAQ